MAKADGSILIQTSIDVSNAEKDLAKLKNAVAKTETEIADMEEKRESAQKQSVFSASELDAEKAKLEAMKRELEEIKSVAKDTSFSVSAREEAKAQIPTMRTDIADQQTRVNMMQAEYNKIENSVARYNERIAEATKKLERQREQAGALAREVNSVSKASVRMADAQQKAEKSMARFGVRLRGVVGSALVFTIVSKALAEFREWMGKVILVNDEASAAVSRFRSALLTLAQPIVEVIIPALVTFINILTQVVSAASSLLSSLFGKTAEESQKAAESLYEQTSALDGVGGAAEDAGKSMASFDEINQLSDAGGEVAGGGGAAAESIAPDFSLGFDLESARTQLENLFGLAAAVGSALLAWKLNSTLLGGLKTFAGLMLAIGGAVTLVKALWDIWQNGIDLENMNKALVGLLMMVGGLALAFGPLGAAIGLIVGGIAMVATAFKDAADNGWNLENTLLGVAGIIATGLGIAILTGSIIPALVGAIAGILLAITTTFGDGQALIEGFQTILTGLKDFVTGIFTGDLELAFQGIEQIFGGLETVFTTVVDAIKNMFLSFLDWLDEKTGGRFSGIIELIKSIISGAAEAIKTQISGIIDGLKNIFSGLVDFVIGVFTGDWDQAWNGVMSIFKGVWNGVISVLETGVNYIVSGINFLISQLNKIKIDIPGWVPGLGGKSIGIAIPPLGEIKLPRLAAGAVIPPNREFLAVLGDQSSGTNIEAPLATIEQAVENVMRRNGNNGGQVTITIKAAPGLPRYLKYELDAETTRRGVKLVGGTV